MLFTYCSVVKPMLIRLDVHNNARITDIIDRRTNYEIRQMLCAPIFDNNQDIKGVAQAINKRSGDSFTVADEVKFKHYLQICGILMRNVQSREQCQDGNRQTSTDRPCSSYHP